MSDHVDGKTIFLLIIFLLSRILFITFQVNFMSLEQFVFVNRVEQNLTFYRQERNDARVSLFQPCYNC